MRAADLSYERRRAALAQNREQVGDDRYREFVAAQGEEALLEAVLQMSTPHTGPSGARRVWNRSSDAWERAGESWLALFFLAANPLYFNSDSGFRGAVLKIACVLVLTLIVRALPGVSNFDQALGIVAVMVWPLYFGVRIVLWLLFLLVG